LNPRRFNNIIAEVREWAFYSGDIIARRYFLPDEYSSFVAIFG